jgi:hypothetical protein
LRQSRTFHTLANGPKSGVQLKRRKQTENQSEDDNGRDQPSIESSANAPSTGRSSLPIDPAVVHRHGFWAVKKNRSSSSQNPHFWMRLQPK